MPDTTLARFLYRWSVFLALPGTTWAAFEAYGLTLGGPQMLFFSIAHTMPLLVLAVWLSVPAGIAWLAQSLVSLVHPRYREKLAISFRALLVFSIAGAFHAAALSWYAAWSVGSLRVPICLLGLLLAGLAIKNAWLEVRRASAPHSSRQQADA